MNRLDFAVALLITVPDRHSARRAALAESVVGLAFGFPGAVRNSIMSVCNFARSASSRDT
jgi:hypothetical protein